MIFIVSFLMFGVVILAMAIGVIFKRPELQGSCGGLASLDIERSCNCKVTCEEHSVLYQIQEPNQS